MKGISGGLMVLILIAITAFVFIGLAAAFSNIQSSFSGNITGNGTAGFIPRFINATTVNNSVIFQQDNNIGINRIDPSDFDADLVVDNQIVNLNGNISTPDMLVSDTLYVNTIKHYFGGEVNIISDFVALGGLFTNNVKISNLGNLMVGSAVGNPSQRLDVRGNANVSGFVNLTKLCFGNAGCMTSPSSGGGGGNPFNQSLNTSDSVLFNNINFTGMIKGGSAYTDILYPGQIFTQAYFNSGGVDTGEILVNGVSDMANEDNFTLNGFNFKLISQGQLDAFAYNARTNRIDFNTNFNLSGTYSQRGQSATSMLIQTSASGLQRVFQVDTTNRRIGVNFNGNPTVTLQVNGTSLFQGTGHIEVNQTTAPTVGTCGTSPSINGTDMAGHVTFGTGVVTSCTVTFATAWTRAPSCVVSDNTQSGIAPRVQTSTTTMIISNTVSIASDIISYICVGYR